MSGKRLLVVEDEIVVAMELRSRLKALGYEVVGICDQGEQTAERVTELRPDLVLMDIKLAGKMDGIEAARRIHTGHDVPVVFLTAHSDEGTLQRAKVSDPYGYIVKPFSERELRTTIEVSLHNHERQKADRQEALWFAKASDTFDDAVMLCDGNGTVKHMNALAEAITGWRIEQARGRPIPEILVLKHRQGEPAMNRFSLRDQDDSGMFGTLSVTLVTADRSEVPVQVMPVPAGDLHGNLGAVLFLFREDPSRLPSGGDDFAHAANLMLTAHLSQSDGEHELAEQCYERALNLLGKTLAPNDSRLGELLLDLAKVYKALGKNLDARMTAAKAETIKSDRHSFLWSAQNTASGTSSIRW